MPDKSSQIVLDSSKRFKAFRKEEGDTQEEFGIRIGKDRSTIMRYEAGVLAIPIDVIKLLHDKLEMSYHWFFDGIGNRKGNTFNRTLITDIGTLNENNLILQGKIEDLEKALRKLAKDFYSKKHKLQKGDFAGTKDN